mmetsp:Transcript_19563/g.54703  ORF Transcript_19563/g.54703 Transcript_19563/m.54703 type:complete len:225 (+) Transcript_19563:795-1469(+)
MASALREVVVVLAEGRLYLAQCQLEVILCDADLTQVLRRAGEVLEVHLAVEGEGGGRPDEARELRPRKVFGLGRELGQRHGGVQVLLLSHGLGVNVQDLLPSSLVGQADLDMHLQAPRSQQSLVDEVHAIRHAYEQNVVQRVHTIDLRKELVHDAVVHACAVGLGASGLADGVDLVENDDVKLRVFALLFVFLLGICEEIPDVLLGLADILVQDLGSIDNLGLG